MTKNTQQILPTALVTGASSGLGSEYCRQLFKDGYNILALARREDRLKALCQELNQSNINANSVRPTAKYIRADLTDPQQLKAVEKRICSEKIDLLVNNAGFGLFGPMLEHDPERESEMVLLNCYALQRLSHCAAKQMVEHRSGAIIILSSVAAFYPMPFLGTYAATKSFDLSHAMALLYELKPFNVKVQVVCPGPTETEFRAVSGMKPRSDKVRKNTALKNTVSDEAVDTHPYPSSLEAQQVVSKSLKGFKAGKYLIIPGFKAKLLALPAQFLPLRLSTYLAHIILKALYH